VSSDPIERVEAAAHVLAVAVDVSGDADTPVATPDEHTDSVASP